MHGRVPPMSGDITILYCIFIQTHCPTLLTPSPLPSCLLSLSKLMYTITFPRIMDKPCTSYPFHGYKQSEFCSHLGLDLITELSKTLCTHTAKTHIIYGLHGTPVKCCRYGSLTGEWLNGHPLLHRSRGGAADGHRAISETKAVGCQNKPPGYDGTSASPFFINGCNSTCNHLAS